MKKKLALVIVLCLVMAMSALPAFASANPPEVSTTDVQSIMTAVTTQFSISNIITYLAYIIGASIGFVFLWWAVRKAWRAILAAATRGRAKL